MKKVIVGLSGIFIASFLIILISAAQNAPKEPKKAQTEMSKDCSKSTAASSCDEKAKAKSSDPAKCADAKKGKADCNTPCPASKEAKECEKTKAECCPKK